MKSRWRARRLERSLTTRPLVYGGNRIELLICGSEYFPRLLQAIAGAQRAIHLETYIFQLDRVGVAVADALAAAAQRGVAVHVLADGYGSIDSIDGLRQRFADSGVRFIAFRPAAWWRLDRRLLRRLHRKMALIDDRLAFVGGINVIDDHNFLGLDGAGFGPRYDFAVCCEGPLVAVIAFVAKRLWRTVSPAAAAAEPTPARHIEPAPPLPDNTRAALLLRDNFRNRRTIERAYIEAVRTARESLLLANAYFLPGRRLRRALMDAAQRGVRVRLLLQGRVEYRLQHYAQASLYQRLLDAGVEIHEYMASYLHAKVAVADASWATVGSSNIDPYSLLLAREANVAVFDAGFARRLHTELDRAIAEESNEVLAAAWRNRPWWKHAAYRIARAIVRVLTFVATRRFDD